MDEEWVARWREHNAEMTAALKGVADAQDRRDGDGVLVAAELLADAVDRFQEWVGRHPAPDDDPNPKLRSTIERWWQLWGQKAKLLTADDATDVATRRASLREVDAELEQLRRARIGEQLN